MEDRGVFEVPPDPLRNELLRSYVQYVYPNFPFLDICKFITAICCSTPIRCVSLLHFHAIMYTSSAFVHQSILAAHGYGSREEAMEVFFKRFKTLYDLNYELDHKVIVQSLLLVAWNDETPQHMHDAAYWLDLAISTARTVGADQKHLMTTFGPASQQFWKRMWWACYVRDRLFAVSQGRPVKISDDSFDLDMLELKDCELIPLPSMVNSTLGGTTIAADGHNRQLLAKVAISLVTFSQLLSQVLSAQYGAVSYEDSTTHQRSVRLALRGQVRLDAVLLQELVAGKWFTELSEDTRHAKVRIRECINDHDEEVLYLQRAQLTCLYHYLIILLHVPQVRAGMMDCNGLAPRHFDHSDRRVREATQAISRIIQDLKTRNLFQYMSAFAITILQSVLIESVSGDSSSTPARSNFQKVSERGRIIEAPCELAERYGPEKKAISVFGDKIMQPKQDRSDGTFAHRELLRCCTQLAPTLGDMKENHSGSDSLDPCSLSLSVLNESPHQYYLDTPASDSRNPSEELDTTTTECLALESTSCRRMYATAHRMEEVEDITTSRTSQDISPSDPTIDWTRNLETLRLEAEGDAFLEELLWF